MAHRHINWDPDELREMRLVRKMSYPAIGRVLGVHHTSVMTRCWLYGIEQRPAPKGPEDDDMPDATPDDTPEVARRRQGLRRRKEERPFPRETDAQARRWVKLLQADAAARALAIAQGLIPAPQLKQPRRKRPSILTEQPRVKLAMPPEHRLRAVNDDAKANAKIREARLAQK